MQNQKSTTKSTKGAKTIFTKTMSTKTAFTKTTHSQNALILAYKPAFITSNAFLGKIKRKYGLAKAGFSGTLDPFAQGSLLIASGAYTKLLPFINTEPKRYEAVLWLGAKSKSLDIENFLGVESVSKFSQNQIAKVLQNLCGNITYTPPSFSAKKISGKRAYALVRSGEEVNLAQSTMSVYSLEILGYNHPFLHFSSEVSKGSYVRSLGELIAQNLGASGVLSALKRTKEGDLCAKKGVEIFLNPLEVLPFGRLELDSHYEDLIKNGAKICIKNTKSGIFVVQFSEFFSIIEILKDGNIKYLCNRISYADTL